MLALTSVIRDQSSKYTNNVQEDPNDYGYPEFMTRFRKCADRNNPQPKVCGALSKVFDTAVRGTGANGIQLSEDREIIDSRDELLVKFDQMDVPNLLISYKRRKIPLTELIGHLKNMSDSFEAYHERLTKYAKENNKWRASARRCKSIYRDERGLQKRHVRYTEEVLFYISEGSA